MVPTEAGMTVYRYAREVLAGTDALKRDIEVITTQQLNHVAIGTSSAYSTYVLPDLLAHFLRAHSGISFTLVEAPSTELIAQVRRGQLDLGIAVLRDPLDDADAHPLGLDELHLIESAALPLSEDQLMTLQELSRAPFIRAPLGPGQVVSANLDNILTAAGLGQANVVMAVAGWDAVKEAVRAGVGLAAVLPSVVRRELDSGEFRLVTVEGYRDVRHVYLLTSPHRQNERETALFQELVEWIRTEFPKMIAAGHPIEEGSAQREPTRLAGSSSSRVSGRRSLASSARRPAS